MPQALLDQLAVPGLMVAPVAGGLVVAVATTSGTTVTRHEGYRFVPLR